MTPNGHTIMDEEPLPLFVLPMVLFLSLIHI